MFNKLNKKEISDSKAKLLGEKNKDKFVGIWVNRNAKRKRPSDVLMSWKIFLDNLEKKEGHRDALLIMHTEPLDNEGPNLFTVSEELGIRDNVFFSRERLDFPQMNVLYNISDFCINISYAEGFGLSTLESMMTGTPIVAVKTGGLTRQVVDHRDGTENGAAIDVKIKSLVGSQAVPFIYEDYAACDEVAEGIMKIYSLNDFEKEMLSEKVQDYAKNEFGMQNTIDMWHDTMLKTLDTWKENNKKWELFKF